MTVQSPGSDALKPVAKCYDSYGQLIKMLLPRAQNIAIFEGHGDLVWANTGFNSPDLRPLVERARSEAVDGSPEVAGFDHHLDDGTPVYVFRLRGDLGELQAVVCLSCRANASGEERPFSLIHGLLTPALSCLQRELAAHSSIGALNRTLDARANDLDLLLAASEEDAGGGAADELRRLVQTCASSLNAVLGAVLIPERNITICRTPQGAARPGESDVLTRTHRHLLSLAQAQGRTMVVNKIASGAPDVPQFKIVSVPLRHATGRVLGILAMFRSADGADFDLRHTRLVELLARRVGAVLDSNYDALTGLLTATAFEQQARAHLSATTAGAGNCVVLVDVDHIDTINNDFGMHVGDEVIAKIAEFLRRPQHAQSFAARIAGDQFALFLTDCEPERALAAAEAMRGAVAQLGPVRGEGSSAISVSCGVARVPAGSVKLAHAIACAEVACKTAKGKGRNCVELYQDADVGIIRRSSDFTLVTLIRDALAGDRFRLDLQTIMPLAHQTASDLYFEVLLRLNDGDGNSVAPAKFLAAAMRAQLLPEIDRWVIANTLRQLNANADILSRHPAAFSINISGAAIAKADFAQFVESTLADHGVAPGRILFEVSEADLATHGAKAGPFFERVRALGCRVALDDFGSGMTSFAQLKDLPIDMIKIDGCLVRDVLANERAATLVAAIAQMARALGIKTVAECVETESVRARIAALGVDFAQGFSIARSQPFGEVLIDLPLFEFFLNQQRAAAGALTLHGTALAS
ncbi:MAG TPA: GGDEF domain-containing protein [Steroidobacteraceae bacterium]|nr:GGDEF domain-containing protein [Steroidobacteraceae bacterium]